MSQTTTKKAPAKKEETADLVQACCGLPKNVHAEIKRAADEATKTTGWEVTFAAMQRKILTDWATARNA